MHLEPPKYNSRITGYFPRIKTANIVHTVLESDVEEQEDNMLSDNDIYIESKERVLQIAENPFIFSVSFNREY